MNVWDVMSKSVLTAKADMSAQEAAAAMARYDLGMLVVVDRQDEHMMIGVITDRDIITKVVARGQYERSVKDIMTKDVVSIDAGQSVEEAKRVLRERHIKRLPVTHDGKLVGVLSVTDLVA